VLDDREALVAFNAGTTPATIAPAPDALRSSGLRPAWPLDADDTEGLSLRGPTAPVALPARAARVWVNEASGS
jgi:hypothetical protein